MKITIEIPSDMIEALKERHVNPEFYQSIIKDYVNHCIGTYYGMSHEDFTRYLDHFDVIEDEYKFMI